MISAKRFLRTFAADRRGATAIEYGLIMALIFLAIITALITLGGNVDDLFQGASDDIVAAQGGGED